MNFTLLDPRPIAVAQEANAKVFAAGPVYGIEVTVPALAARCYINIDPQHTEGNAERAAIEVALEAELPSEGAVLTTVRADLDSVGAMAILSLRAEGTSLEPAMERINMVAISDKFARGGYVGPRPLPTRDNPWDESTATVESFRQLAAIAAAVADFKVPLADRVSEMKTWLLTGEEPAQYRIQVEKERLDMITALETGRIKHETRSDGRIVVVETTHRAATSVGYALAPVVVALNPEFRFGPGGEPVRKFTICQYETGYVDLRVVFAELNKLEPGWGGSPNIGGSPQGVSSKLTIEEILTIVEKHLAFLPGVDLLYPECHFCGNVLEVWNNHFRGAYIGNCIMCIQLSYNECPYHKE